jgi:hypothetical protein
VALTTSDPQESTGKLLFEQGGLDDFASKMEQVEDVLPSRVNADADGVEHGLAKLVLTLIELLRQLLERQALKRIENGSVNDDEIERLGDTFQKLQARMEELKRTFHLENEELNLDLGPLGNLL